MAALPTGVFNVNVNSGSNPALSGALNTKNAQATYKGQNVTVTWDAANSIIGWSYTAQGATQANVFSNGKYTPGTPPPPNAYNMGSFSGGTVTIPDSVAGSADEAWSATASGSGEDEEVEDEDDGEEELPKYAKV